MKKKVQKRYDREFKLGAVKLVVEEGKSILQVAKDLGVSDKSSMPGLRSLRLTRTLPFLAAASLSRKTTSPHKNVGQAHRSQVITPVALVACSAEPPIFGQAAANGRSKMTATDDRRMKPITKTEVNQAL